MPLSSPAVSTIATKATGIDQLLKAIEQILIPENLRMPAKSDSEFPIEYDLQIDRVALPITQRQSQLVADAATAENLVAWTAAMTLLARPLNCGTLQHPASP